MKTAPSPSVERPPVATSPMRCRLFRPAPPSIIHCLIISDRQIWLIAAGLIAVDLLVFMIPIVPVLAAYVLVARPAWFKEFIDDVYDRTGPH